MDNLQDILDNTNIDDISFDEENIIEIEITDLINLCYSLSYKRWYVEYVDSDGEEYVEDIIEPFVNDLTILEYTITVEYFNEVKEIIGVN